MPKKIRAVQNDVAKYVSINPSDDSTAPISIVGRMPKWWDRKEANKPEITAGPLIYNEICIGWAQEERSEQEAPGICRVHQIRNFDLADVLTR